MTTREKNKEIGRRLKEGMKREGVKKYADLLNKTSDDFEHPHNLTESHISDIVNGRRNLPKNGALAFSKVFKFDPGYLLGADGFVYSSYDDYLIGHIKQEELRQNWNKYRDILRLAGAKIKNIIYDDNYNILEYHISKDGRHSAFSPEDMDRHMNRFYEDLCEYASKRFDPVMELGETDRPPVQITTEHGTITDEDRREGR